MSETDLTSIGKRIQGRRKQLGYTQEQLTEPFFLLCLAQFRSPSVFVFRRNNPMVGMTVSVAVAVEESCK